MHEMSIINLKRGKTIVSSKLGDVIKIGHVSTTEATNVPILTTFQIIAVSIRTLITMLICATCIRHKMVNINLNVLAFITF